MGIWTMSPRRIRAPSMRAIRRGPSRSAPPARHPCAAIESDCNRCPRPMRRGRVGLRGWAPARGGRAQRVARARTTPVRRGRTSSPWVGAGSAPALGRLCVLVGYNWQEKIAQREDQQKCEVVYNEKSYTLHASTSAVRHPQQISNKSVTRAPTHVRSGTTCESHSKPQCLQA